MSIAAVDYYRQVRPTIACSFRLQAVVFLVIRPSGFLKALGGFLSSADTL